MSHRLIRVDSGGNYGVQLRIHRGMQLCMRGWGVVSPRLTTVTGTLQKTRAGVHAVSAHAPHDKDTDEAKNTFWHELQITVLNLMHDDDFFIFLAIDANARLGHGGESASVGHCDRDLETDNGARFQAFLQSSGLAAVNTFFECGRQS